MQVREVLKHKYVKRLFLGRFISNFGNGLGPIALAVIKRNVPVDATLICEGVSASQEELALR